MNAFTHFVSYVAGGIAFYAFSNGITGLAVTALVVFGLSILVGGVTR